MNAVINLAPTLHSSAVLISLKISVWNTKKKDKRASEKVEVDAGAMGKVGAYNKNIVPGFTALEDLGKFAADCRNWLTRSTVPWAFDGVNLVSTAVLWNGFDQELKDREKRFWDQVEIVLDEYANARQIAQFKLGSLFDANEYPTVDEVRGKFRFEYGYYPVPEAGDFRVDVHREGLSFLEEQFERERQKALGEAMATLWERVRKVVETLSNQLRVTKNEKGKLYQSTLDTALELCSMMRDMNLTGDTKMEQVRRELYSVVNGMDLQDLKKDDGQRVAIKQEIDALLSKFDF